MKSVLNLTREELVEMVYCIGDADRNPLLGSRIYDGKYSDRNSSLQKLRFRFGPIGNVANVKKKVAVGPINEGDELKILFILHTSTMEIAVPNVSKKV